MTVAVARVKRVSYSPVPVVLVVCEVEVCGFEMGVIRL